MSKLLFAAAGLALVAVPTGAMAERDKPERLDENRRICKKSIDTGSLIRGKKVCRTALEWRLMAEAARRDLEQSSTSGGSNNN